MLSTIAPCNNHGVPPSTTSAAQEAWTLFWRIFRADKPRRMAVFSELGLSFQQAMALGHLEPGVPLPMSALAGALQCDNSNVTGIVDRLEAAGLAERRPDERDRRVKTIVLTPHGEAVRDEVQRRAGTPPPEIAALSEADAALLRDVLQRALDG
jgi:DNA-binding MarR family transcriptional regulator